MPKDPFARFPRIESGGLLLRQIVPDDLDGMLAIYTNANLFRYTPGSAKKTREAVAHMIGHFERDFTKRKTIFLGICLRSEPGTIVGIGEMFDYDPKVNAITIGYRLNEAYWSRGIAANAVKLMADYLFRELGLNRVQAFVMPENARSHPVLLKNGFTLEGTIRQGQLWTGKGIVDLMLYSLLRSDWEALNP